MHLLLERQGAAVKVDGVVRGFEGSGFGVGITLPLIDYGSRRHRIHEAEEAARAQANRVAIVHVCLFIVFSSRGAVTLRR